jgi:hypothetical protein
MHVLELENLEFRERSLLYSGLLLMVKSNSGTGFANNDQGHPAYRAGRSGEDDYNTLGDSPAHRPIYQLMKALGAGLAEGGEFAATDIVTDWSSFCILATDAYDQTKKG